MTTGSPIKALVEWTDREIDWVPAAQIIADYPVQAAEYLQARDRDRRLHELPLQTAEGLEKGSEASLLLEYSGQDLDDLEKGEEDLPWLE